MGMSRCYSLIKCLLILFNIVFLVVGVCACAACVWALWEGRGGEAGGAAAGAGAAAGGAARAGLAALLAWAVVLTVGAFATLCGAVRWSGSLLAGGAALLALAAAAEAAAACWGGAHLPQLRRALTDALLTTVHRDYGLVESRTLMLDAIQQGLECCGAESARDWQNSAWSRAALAAADESQDASAPSQDASAPSQDAPAPAQDAPAPAPHVQRALDLSVAAPAEHYWVPPSCCSTSDESECESSRRVAWTAGAGAGAGAGARGLHESACAARVLAALGRSARAPLCAAAALLVAHALAVLLALALCLKATPDTTYKA